MRNVLWHKHTKNCSVQITVSAVFAAVHDLTVFSGYSVCSVVLSLFKTNTYAQNAMYLCEASNSLYVSISLKATKKKQQQQQKNGLVKANETITSRLRVKLIGAKKPLQIITNYTLELRLHSESKLQTDHIAWWFGWCGECECAQIVKFELFYDRLKAYGKMIDFDPGIIRIQRKMVDFVPFTWRLLHWIAFGSRVEKERERERTKKCIVD